jgi:hypothetical protein
MRNLFALLLLAGVFGGGCKVATNDPPPSPGRWQVIQTEWGSIKEAILLDTYTGETWAQHWDEKSGTSWKRAEKK